MGRALDGWGAEPEERGSDGGNDSESAHPAQVFLQEDLGEDHRHHGVERTQDADGAQLAEVHGESQGHIAGGGE